MVDKVIENNKVTIIGEVVSEFKFSHEVYGEGFYTVDISVNRLSNSVDVIPLMVSERLVDVTVDLRGTMIEAQGQFRSYNRHEETKNRLVLSILSGSFSLLRIMMRRRVQIRFFLTGTYASRRFTARHRLEGRLPIFL